MSNLYIIGAGCSRNYSSDQNIITDLSPPLNEDFFKMAKLVLAKTGMRYDENFMEDINALLKKLSKLYGLDSNLSMLDSEKLNLEDVMTILDVDYKMFSSLYININKNQSSPHLKLLIDLLVRTLDYALKGDCCRKHNKIVQKMKKNDLILNYNYDMLFDIPLLNSKKFTHEGYKINFYRTYNKGEWNKIKESPSNITMLKLHGSVNWIRCDICGSILNLGHDKVDGLFGYIPFTCPKCKSNDSHTSRMIIPPLQVKDYSDKDIAYLWLKADSMLSDIDNITIIGYSFSPSDYASTSLYRRYASNRNIEPSICLVSPTNRLVDRISDLFNVSPEVISQYSFDDYLETL